MLKDQRSPCGSKGCVRKATPDHAAPKAFTTKTPKTEQMDELPFRTARPPVHTDLCVATHLVIKNKSRHGARI